VFINKDDDDDDATALFPAYQVQKGMSSGESRRDGGLSRGRE